LRYNSISQYRKLANWKNRTRKLANWMLSPGEQFMRTNNNTQTNNQP
jgi:hypothetical protein